MNKIGKYQITGELGRGGMGVVYQGTDPYIGRPVAVKTIQLEGVLHPREVSKARDRLIREARSAGNLKHPGIVTIYDVGEDQGLMYIAMEYIQGRSLEDLILSGKRFTFEETAGIAEQLADALDYAHSQGVVHKDIKPANVLIDDTGSVHIVDFGIAQWSAAATRTQSIMGTPHYMSPEQVAGRPVDPRSDGFSLGVILYELLTGAKPFPGDNITTVIYKIMNEPPPAVQSQRPGLPLELNAVIGRALSKSPEERFNSCRELAGALRHYQSYRAASIPAVPDRSVDSPSAPVFKSERSQSGSRPLLAVIAAMMVVLLTVLVIVLLTYRSSGDLAGGSPGGGGPPAAETEPLSQSRGELVKPEEDPQQPPENEIDPDSGSGTEIPAESFYKDEAGKAFRDKKLEELKNILDEGLSHYPQSADLWSSQAGYYLLLRRADPAIRAAEKALELEPGEPVHSANLGWLYQELKNDCRRALDYYRRGQDFGKQNPVLYFRMGECAEQVSSLSEAAGCYRLLLQNDPYSSFASTAIRRLAYFKDADPSINLAEAESPWIWRGEYQSVLIDHRSFVSYPAIFLSLEKPMVYRLPPNLDDLQGAAVEADLWIEPREPEISGLNNRFDEITHVGRDTQVALTSGDSFQSAGDTGVTWRDRLPANDVVAGLIFLVRSSSGRLFKVRVEEVESEKLILSFREVH